jgi:shikimate dehydrogenase
MTYILGVLGHPLDHSLSVPMHMSAIFTLGIDYVYMSFDVLPENLSHAVSEFKKQGIKGFNVTIPYKETIIPYLDELDEHAKRIGAVNTVNNEEDRLKGYNTDGRGYLRSLIEQTGFSPVNKHVLMIGAGGAARAIAFSLLESGVKRLTLINRTIQRAQRLADHLGLYFPEAILETLSMDHINAIPHEGIHLIVNTTPAGMKHIKQTNIDGLVNFLLTDRSLSKDTIISDIVYNPMETPLLREAKNAGFKTHDGIGMLVYQGAESFKIWTGIYPPVDIMRQSVIRALLQGH